MSRVEVGTLREKGMARALNVSLGSSRIKICAKKNQQKEGREKEKERYREARVDFRELRDLLHQKIVEELSSEAPRLGSASVSPGRRRAPGEAHPDARQTTTRGVDALFKALSEEAEDLGREGVLHLGTGRVRTRAAPKEERARTGALSAGLA